MLKYKIHTILILFVIILLMLLKISIDNLLNKEIKEEEYINYNNKMDLILKKTNGLYIEKNERLSFFIDSIKSDNKVLNKLAKLNNIQKKDNKISIKEYHEFNDLFDKLYN